MKTTNGFARSRRARTSRSQRAQLLAAFERSGLSAAAFARQHQLHYTTFCNWRRRQAKARPSPGFVQVELSASPSPAVLLVELGGGARLRLTDAGQIELAARLIQTLRPPTPC
jgi:transposase-like protein